MKKLTTLIAALSIVLNLYSQKRIEKDFKTHFEKFGVDGCFVLYNQSDDELLSYNSELCDSGHIPASTFKIPHSLIVLEEGVVKDTNQIIKWNGHKWSYEPWNRDQTLKTALKYSCVWAYVGFAKQIPINKYYEYVNAFDYGNRNLVGTENRFWLEGEFRISARQQIEFLRKFYNEKLNVSKHSIEMVKEIIILDKNQNYCLSGKTGAGVISENGYIMWLVGYVERGDNTYFYALNFESSNFSADAGKRMKITKSILSELGLID